MKLIHADSLAATLDSLNEAYFEGHPLSKAAREGAARWITGRRGKPGSYAGMFAPTESDFAAGIRFFTGEKMASMAGTSHILGEEACRAMILVDARNKAAGQALLDATKGMIDRLDQSQALGFYCCASCSASLWRHLAVGGLNKQEQRLRHGIKYLSGLRDGNGRWRVFPFYYTLLALSEIDLPPAIKELRYAAPACERALKRKASRDKYDRRRRGVAQRALEKC